MSKQASLEGHHVRLPPLDNRPLAEACSGVKALVAAFSCRNGLSRRQTEVIEHAALGRGRKEVALLLGCSPKTVEEHWRRIYQKTGHYNEATLLSRILFLAVERRWERA
jgi:DNA-binding NarL/FixJ family response regulator